MDRIAEPVEVEADFCGRKILPLNFIWRGRKYTVLRVALQFERKDGGRRYWAFAVDTGGNMAELLLDREDLTWRIAACEPSCT